MRRAVPDGRRRAHRVSGDAQRDGDRKTKAIRKVFGLRFWPRDASSLIEVDPPNADPPQGLLASPRSRLDKQAAERHEAAARFRA